MLFSPRNSSLYLINSKVIFQAPSRSYNDLRWRENPVQHWHDPRISVSLTLDTIYTWMALLHAGCSFSFVLDRKLKVYQALSSVFWQAIPLLSQSLNSSSKPRTVGNDHEVILDLLYLYLDLEYSVLMQFTSLTHGGRLATTFHLQLLLISSVSHKHNKEFTWCFFKSEREHCLVIFKLNVLLSYTSTVMTCIYRDWRQLWSFGSSLKHLLTIHSKNLKRLWLGKWVIWHFRQKKWKWIHEWAKDRQTIFRIE